MGWQKLLQLDVQQFIKNHECDDVRSLALKTPPDPSWPYSLILDQIKVRQKARLKSLELYETHGIIFPINDVYEQASSSACAAYKASLVNGERFVDLTAGSGADAYAFAKRFKSGVLVERDEACAALLEHNVDVLDKVYKAAGELTVHHGDAAAYVQGMSDVDFAFIDPQRREGGRKGIYDLSACSPDIISLLPVLKSKAQRVIVKTSPVLDIEKAIVSLGSVTQVHVVQWQGECKEVLYNLNFSSSVKNEDVEIVAVDIDSSGKVQQRFSYKISDEKNAALDYAMPKKYIYEPGPAFQKSGGFKSMALAFSVQKLHQHSHLYTSDDICMNFPGKRYEVVDVVSVKAKGLGVKKADLTLRNFPGTVQMLRKKLKLSDGGCHRIFATTLCDETKKLIICNKL
ncbi:MAG: hypothetical protein COB14_00245 [Alphaproteobacteria bacterium]|nr:MAG: hypothetical protein COB14_00245 [Alphaproteobacteria bacterium]